MLLGLASMLRFVLSLLSTPPLVLWEAADEDGDDDDDGDDMDEEEGNEVDPMTGLGEAEFETGEVTVGDMYGGLTNGDEALDKGEPMEGGEEEEGGGDAM